MIGTQLFYPHRAILELVSQRPRWKRGGLGCKKVSRPPDSASWVAGCAQARESEVGIACPRGQAIRSFPIHTILYYRLHLLVHYPSIRLNYQTRGSNQRCFRSRYVTPTWNPLELIEPYLSILTIIQLTICLSISSSRKPPYTNNHTPASPPNHPFPHQVPQPSLHKHRDPRSAS